jgi:hypothetical protein
LVPCLGAEQAGFPGSVEGLWGQAWEGVAAAPHRANGCAGEGKGAGLACAEIARGDDRDWDRRPAGCLTLAGARDPHASSLIVNGDVQPFAVNGGDLNVVTAEDLAFAQSDRTNMRRVAHPAAQGCRVRPVGDRDALSQPMGARRFRLPPDCQVSG